MAVGLHTKDRMVVCAYAAKDKEDVTGMLSGLALREGYVDETFLPALLKRESEYPTGLPTQTPIAMPHVHDGCAKTFFAMATLTEPVAFGCMGDPEETVEVRHVFLFGITDPSQQTEVLRKFSVMFQDSEFLRACLACEHQPELMALLRERLGDSLIFEND